MEQGFATICSEYISVFNPACFQLWWYFWCSFGVLSGLFFFLFLICLVPTHVWMIIVALTCQVPLSFKTRLVFLPCATPSFNLKTPISCLACVLPWFHHVCVLQFPVWFRFLPAERPPQCFCNVVLADTF